MNLEEQREKLISAGWSAIRKDKSLKADLVQLYRQLGQDICSSCLNILYTKYHDLKTRNLQNTIIMEEKRIFLKGASMDIPYTGKTYLRETMTEEEAIKVIKENPERAQFFELHKDATLEDLIKEYDTKSNPTPKKTVQAATEAFEQSQPQQEQQVEEESKKEENKESSGKSAASSKSTSKKSSSKK